jgi:pyruvate/2-oxoglutarate dehydrogenase complex dihydrolipoamide dehydrogenase (E3) component
MSSCIPVVIDVFAFTVEFRAVGARRSATFLRTRLARVLCPHASALEPVRPPRHYSADGDLILRRTVDDVDVLVIGTGQAGVPLATRLAGAGRRVAIVERAAAGGTCVNYGCTPTKTMVASARAAHVARTAGRLGVRVADVQVDFAAVVRRKDDMVREWRTGVEKRLADAGDRLELVRGHARFVGPRTVRVDGRTIAANAVVINVGARPASPPIDGLETVSALDNASIMELDALPEHLLVLGGGYIGCEFGQMFRRFGARVTIIEHGAHLLGREDVDISDAIEQVFRAEDIALRFGHGVARVEPCGGGIAVTLASDERIEGSHLLVAAGRQPNTDDLGCAAAGIVCDERGAIRVDDRFRTSAEGVYAVGDVNGGPQFTHTAWDDHRILFDLLEGRDRSAAGRLVPYTVFTDPQVARVGISEREAAAGGLRVEVGQYEFGSIARARELDERAGIVKVLVDADSERILGAAIVGIEAGELIHILLALMRADAPARALVDAQIVHPTLAEGVQGALMNIPRYAL